LTTTLVIYQKRRVTAQFLLRLWLCMSGIDHRMPWVWTDALIIANTGDKSHPYGIQDLLTAIAERVVNMD
jgi:hypothetical protein